MLAFRRSLSTCIRNLQKQNPTITETYSKLLSQPCFDPIRDKLPKEIDELDPYTVSQKVGESLQGNPSVSTKQLASIHNLFIEKLTKHEYAIATIHSKKLKSLNESVTIPALLEIIQNNPGRVSSSWELFIEYMQIFKNLPDDVLISVLNKTVFFDPVDVKDGKKELDIYDMTHSLFLLDRISNPDLVDKQIIDVLVKSAITLNATAILPILLKREGTASLEPFEESADQLTAFQIYILSKFYPFATLKENGNLLHKVLTSLGRNKEIIPTEEEKDVSDKIQMQRERIENQLHTQWKLDSLSLEPLSTEVQFRSILDNIATYDLHKKDISLAKGLLRSIGVHRDDTKSFLEIYHMLLSSFPGKEEDLLFEAFLALAYQSFKSNNPAALQFSEAYISESPSDPTRTKILCTQILANSKFNIEESLNIYNANIQKASKEKNEITNVSSSDMLTHALILAYLYNKDLDFARVIFDGSVGSKALSGATAVKNVKELLAQYGEYAERGDLEDMMENIILRKLENM